VEDAVVAGKGRYMIIIFGGGEGGGHANTLRRVFTMWGRWDGRAFCGVTWPNGNHIGVYNASGNIVENAVAYGRALTGIFIQANADDAVANDNQVLGSLALLGGRDYDGSVWTYGTGAAQPTTRPGPTADATDGRNCDADVAQWEWGGQRLGFSLFGQGTLKRNLFRDVLAADNLGPGFSASQPYAAGDKAGNRLDRLTLYANGAGNAPWENELGPNIVLRMDGVSAPTNSRIAASLWAAQGSGARLQYRYVDGKLTNVPLLPWPMEARIQAELGMSVGKIVQKYAQ
jgi:hypothetical protein